MSTNGTYLNKEKIGKGIRKVIINNDKISLTTADRKIFIFNDSKANNVKYQDIADKYTVCHKLGTGQFGAVHLAYANGASGLTPNKRCAIKTILKV